MILALILSLLVPVPQERRDRVLLTSGAAVDGVVKSESPRDVTVDTGSGKTQTLRVEEISRIDYFDMPPTFPALYEALDQGKPEEGLNALNAAETLVKEYRDPKANPARKKLIPRDWFDPAALYYRALCHRELKEWEKALGHLDKIIATHAKSRFVKQALVWKFECALADGKDDVAQAAIQEMQKQASLLGPDLVPRSEILQADHLAGKGQHDKARAIYQRLTAHSDPTISSQATLGLLRSLQEQKSPDLQQVCERTLNDATKPMGARLIAATLLGDVLAAKNPAAAIPVYVKAVVLLHPGRADSLAAEHERALFRLAECYDEVHKQQPDMKKKATWSAMALSAFREVTTAYPSGRLKDRAAGRATELEKLRSTYRSSSGESK